MGEQRRGKTTVKVELTPEKREKCEKTLQTAGPGPGAKRVRAVLLSSQGKSPGEIGKALGASDQAVRSWLKKCHAARECCALVKEGKPGRPRQLAPGTEESIAADLEKKPGEFGYCLPIWTIALVKEHAQRSHGVALSDYWAHKLLSGEGTYRGRGESPEQFASEVARLENAGGHVVWHLDVIGIKPTFNLKNRIVIRDMSEKYFLFFALHLKVAGHPDRCGYYRVKRINTRGKGDYRAYNKYLHHFVLELIKHSDRDYENHSITLVLHPHSWAKEVAGEICPDNNGGVRVMFTPGKKNGAINYHWHCPLLREGGELKVAIKKWARENVLDRDTAGAQIKKRFKELIDGSQAPSEPRPSQGYPSKGFSKSV